MLNFHKKIRQTFLLTVIFIISHLPLAGQPTQVWVNRYNGNLNGTDIAKALAVSTDGSIYVTGVSRENTAAGHITTIKYNAIGMQEWIDHYALPGSGNINTGVAISIQDEALGGNIFVGGIVEHWEGDFALIKYTPDGTRLWTQSYSGLYQSGEDFLVDMECDKTGGAYVLGKVNLGNGSGFDLATLRYDENGNLLWEKNYSGASSTTDIPRALTVDDSNRVYIVSKSFNFYGSGTYDYTTICYLPDGTELWVVNYNGPGNGTDQPVDITNDSQQNQYITGYVTGSDGTLDFGTIMQNHFGTRLWEATYNGSASGADSAVSVAIDPNGNIYVTGKSMEIHGLIAKEAITTISYTSQGQQRWIQHFFGQDEMGAVPSTVKVDRFGGVYVSGRQTHPQQNSNFVILKYDTSGVMQWIAAYDGPAHLDDEILNMFIDQNANIFVTGYSKGIATSHDIATIHYTQDPTGIPTNPEDLLADSYILQQNYPNPFNPVTNIKFRIADFPNGAGGFVALRIYDMMGRTVRTLIQRRLSPGEYEVQWDGTNDTGQPVASGVYFYRLATYPLNPPSKGVSQYRKMILLR